MHQQAKLSSLGFQKFLTKFSRTPLFWNLVPEHPPPPEMKFFPESKSDLTQNTPLEMKFIPKSLTTQNTPPPKIENSNFLSRVQNLPYSEPPPKIENSNFLSRVQNLPYPEHPPSPKSPTHPPSPTPTPQWRLKYVETNGCIPQGYHLVGFI